MIHAIDLVEEDIPGRIVAVVDTRLVQPGGVTGKFGNHLAALFHRDMAELVKILGVTGLDADKIGVAYQPAAPLLDVSNRVGGFKPQVQQPPGIVEGPQSLGARKNE